MEKLQYLINGVILLSKKYFSEAQFWQLENALDEGLEKAVSITYSDCWIIPSTFLCGISACNL